MARFKVGDRVVCIVPNMGTAVKEGDIGVIVPPLKDGGYDYYVDFPRRKNWPMYEEELAHDKEYQVLTILRYVKATRNSL